MRDRVEASGRSTRSCGPNSAPGQGRPGRGAAINKDWAGGYWGRIMAAKITRDVLEAHLNCKYKGRLQLDGEEGRKSDYEVMTTDVRRQLRARVVADLLARQGGGETWQGAILTTETLKKGLAVIADAMLGDELVSLLYDGLVRAEGASALGDFHYVPILCCDGDKIRQQQKHLLAVYGLILGSIQGRHPASGVIIQEPGCSRIRVKLSPQLYKRAGEALEAVKQLQAGGKAPPLMLNGHCRVCEFRQRCHAEAVRQDDLSLLRGLGENEIRKQNRKGIFTVTQLSHTFRPRRKGKRAKGLGQPHHPALQALAIREGKTFVFARPTVPNPPTRVYLDLEGDSDGSFVYLAGVLVVEDGVERRHSFWADGPADEERLLQQLLEVVDGKDYALFHFGSYERRFLKRMRRVAKRKTPVDRLLANSVDVLSVIRSNVYFPVYANGLKEIGKHLGYAWTDPEASGVQSLVWRWRWEQTRDGAWKQRLIAYNGEDCVALRRIVEHVEAIGANFDQDEGGGGTADQRSVERVKAGKRGSDFRKWGHTAFLLPEFETISKCAWFDYQREKIVVRKTKRTLTRTAGRGKKARQPRPNRRIVVRSNRCPACKGRHLSKVGQQMRKKLTFDLKVSEGGVRRVVTQYLAARYRCLDCGSSFLPRRYKKLRRFQHTLQSWTLYQHVANRMTFDSLEGIFKECFGLTISISDLHRFKSELASRYQGTYRSLLKQIIAGNLLHADETGVQFKEGKGYVWVFTNLEDVVFMCRPSREADFLGPLLGGFSGVLVSDFYKGYDSMPCPQQKCLVHLIRDINGDLMTYFHDEELKGLARCLGSLLVRIVATIDRWGLQRSHLQTHKADVQKFFGEACERPYQSEVAEQYRKRLLKYRDKLFTFLDHDGVPWHNNNAEHAVKHFAKYRMISNGRMTANGLQDYLVLLSIYQTCVYKGVSFLRFLLSGERDVDTFVEARQRRRPTPVPPLDGDGSSVGCCERGREGTPVTW
jgi:predicted RecB family nuclease